MKTGWFSIMWVAWLVLAVLAGVLIRLSYTDFNAQAAEKLGGFTVANTGLDVENTKWKTVRQLQNEADYILKVKKTGQTTFLYKTILSQAQVMHVYKGDASLAGEQIYVYEPCFVFPHVARYYPAGGCNMMLDGQEYLLFLNKREFPQGYTPQGVEQNSYLFTTNCALSKYTLDPGFQQAALVMVILPMMRSKIWRLSPGRESSWLIAGLIRGIE